MYHKKDQGKSEGEGIHRRQFFKGKCEARLEFPEGAQQFKQKDPKTLYLVRGRGRGTTWVSHLSTVHDTVYSIRSLWDIDSVTIIYIRHWFVKCLEPLLGTLSNQDNQVIQNVT